MNGNLIMKGYKITYLADPESHRDVVHKGYVDTQTVSKHWNEKLDDLQFKRVC